MDRPINPDPDEYPKIRRAFKAASLLRWTRGIGVRLAFLIGLIVGVTSNWYWGVAVIVTGYALNLATLLFGRCPRCGRTWAGEDLEDCVCKRCRLNIGLGLRDR